MLAARTLKVGPLHVAVAGEGAPSRVIAHDPGLIERAMFGTEGNGDRIAPGQPAVDRAADEDVPHARGFVKSKRRDQPDAPLRVVRDRGVGHAVVRTTAGEL